MRVTYSRRAIEQLESLYQYIADDSDPTRAMRFVGSIMEYCDGFVTFPQRGVKRDDIRPNLRLVSFRRRVTIAFSIDEECVNILGIYYGGQSYEAALQDE